MLRRSASKLYGLFWKKPIVTPSILERLEAIHRRIISGNLLMCCTDMTNRLFIDCLKLLLEKTCHLIIYSSCKINTIIAQKSVPTQFVTLDYNFS